MGLSHWRLPGTREALKDRKGRELTLDEITNVENVANVLAFTIAQMEKIDEAYRAAFAKAGNWSAPLARAPRFAYDSDDSASGITVNHGARLGPL